MSMFGMFGGRAPTSAEKITAVENELKVVAEMHTRMVKICSLKCVDKTYREGELSKGEAVCLDRCAAKFFEAHAKISDHLQQQSQQQGGSFGV